MPQREIARRLGVSERMAGRYIAQAVEACAQEETDETQWRSA
ncbi:hypothetical protein [Modicisalibacter luteus]